MTKLIKVAFPKMNKTDSLDETDYEISMGRNVQKCKVMREVEVGNAVYNCLAEEFMANGNEAIWGYIGGSESNDPRLEVAENIHQIMNNPELKQIFLDTMYTKVTEVLNKDTGDRFYVNTEGHGYARYVGRKI